MGTEGLDILSPAITYDYNQKIFQLDLEWNSDGLHWWVIYEADVEMRSIRFKEYLRRMRRTDHPGLKGESFRNGDRRMEALFEMALQDDAFWAEEVEKRVTRLRLKLTDPKSAHKEEHGPLRREPLNEDAPSRKSAAVLTPRTEQPPPATASKTAERNARKRAAKKARIAASNARFPPPTSLTASPPPPAPPAVVAGQQGLGRGGRKGFGKNLGQNATNQQNNKGKGAGKTGICHQWARTGTCPRGTSCWFAASHV